MMHKHDILANCLTDVQSGRATIEECLAHYPNEKDELRPLFEIALRIRPVGAPATEEFKERVRRQLAKTMAMAAARSRRPARRHRSGPRSSNGLASTLILAAVGTAGTIYAAHASVPGDTAYPTFAVAAGLAGFVLAKSNT